MAVSDDSHKDISPFKPLFTPKNLPAALRDFLRDYEEQAPSKPMRLVKYISQRVSLSRRTVDALIQRGHATVDGSVVTNPATHVGVGNVVIFRGNQLPVAEETPMLFGYHKPKGLLTSHGDPFGRPCVWDHLPDWLPAGLVSVGRLDQDTEGLLLLTNSGALKRFMELPKNALQRRYRVWCKGAPLSKDHVLQATKGLQDGDINYRPFRLDLKPDSKICGEGMQSFRHKVCDLTLTEGKKREVRRIMTLWGNHVTRLVRLSYGPFLLSGIKNGDARRFV